MESFKKLSVGKSNDTLRDLFSRLKCASKAKCLYATVPYSILNVLLLKKFYEKGLIASFILADTMFIKVYLKYDYKGFGILDDLTWFF